MNPIAKGIVIHDYEASEYDEISIKKRDKFDLLCEYEDGWWYVDINGNKGMIPGNYAKIIERIRPATNGNNVESKDKIEEDNSAISSSFITPRPSSSDPDIESETVCNTPLLTPSLKNNEIDRFQALRQETSNKIDELKFTVSNNEKSLRNSARRPVKTSSPLKNISSPKTKREAASRSLLDGEEDDNVSILSTNSSTSSLFEKKDKVFHQNNNNKPIQKVALDSQSLNLISKIVNEKIQRELSTRDKKIFEKIDSLLQQQQPQFTPVPPPLSTSSSSSDINEINKENTVINSSSRNPSRIPKMRLPRINQQTVNKTTPKIEDENRKSLVNNNSNFLPPINQPKDLGGITSGGNNNPLATGGRGVNPSLKKFKEEWINPEGVQYPQCRSVVFPSSKESKVILQERKNHALISGGPYSSASLPTPLINSPAASLQLNYVHGYDGDINNHGKLSSNNILWLTHASSHSSSHNISTSLIAYPSASLVVVMDVNTLNQNFFTGHTEDVTCLSLHPIHPLIASGQKGNQSRILIWNYEYLLKLKGTQQNVLNHPELAELLLPPSVRGVATLNFSGDGKLILASSIEESRSIYIFDWKKGEILTNCKIGHSHIDSHSEILFNPYNFHSFSDNIHPKQGQKVNGVLLPPSGCHCLVSYCGKQIKFWTLKLAYLNSSSSSSTASAMTPMSPDSRMKKYARDLQFVLEGKLATSKRSSSTAFEYTCCTFLPSTNSKSCKILLGSSIGTVFIWQQKYDNITENDNSDLSLGWLPQGQLIFTITDFHDSPMTSLQSCFLGDYDDQSILFDLLTSTDKNGNLFLWKVERNPHQKSIPIEKMSSFQLQESNGRAIAWDKNDCNRFVLGIADNSLALFQFDPQEMMQKDYEEDRRNEGEEENIVKMSSSFILHSHNGKVKKIVSHPLVSYLFLTISSDRTIRFWNCLDHTLISCLDLEHPATSCAFSAEGDVLAVGNEKGEIIFLYSELLVEFINKLLNSSNKHNKNKKKKKNFEEICDWKIIGSKILTPQEKSSVTSSPSKPKQKKIEISCMRYSPNGKYLAIACKDSQIYLFSTPSHNSDNDFDNEIANSESYQIKLIGICKGHTSQIRTLDFSCNNKIIRTTDSSKELLYYEVETSKRITNNSLVKDLSWASSSSIYEWYLQGIFNRYNGDTFLPSDGDINCVSCYFSSQHDLVDNEDGNDSVNSYTEKKDVELKLIVACGTQLNQGGVKLFHYPALPDAIPKMYGGHSAPVSDALFLSTPKGPVLVTAGGNDSCVFIWDVVRED